MFNILTDNPMSNHRIEYKQYKSTKKYLIQKSLEALKCSSPKVCLLILVCLVLKSLPFNLMSPNLHKCVLFLCLVTYYIGVLLRLLSLLFGLTTLVLYLLPLNFISNIQFHSPLLPHITSSHFSWS